MGSGVLSGLLVLSQVTFICNSNITLFFLVRFYKILANGTRNDSYKMTSSLHVEGGAIKHKSTEWVSKTFSTNMPEISAIWTVFVVNQCL